MTYEKIKRNDQADGRPDGNAAGTWPGSGTTVDGKVETATTGIGGDADEKLHEKTPRGSTSTSAPTQEPVDLPAEERAGE